MTKEEILHNLGCIVAYLEYEEKRERETAEQHVGFSRGSHYGRAAHAKETAESLKAFIKDAQ